MNVFIHILWLRTSLPWRKYVILRVSVGGMYIFYWICCQHLRIYISWRVWVGKCTFFDILLLMLKFCPQSRLSSKSSVLKVVCPQCSCPQRCVLNVVCPQCPIVVETATPVIMSKMWICALSGKCFWSKVCLCTFLDKYHVWENA